MDDNDEINSIVNNLKKQDQQNYGIAVFNINLKVTKKGVVFFGEVLTDNQKNQVLELAKKEKIKVALDKIKVLSDSSKRYEFGWVVVKDKIIDLKFRFVSNKIINEKILKKIRCSQAFRGEILRVLYKNEDQLLVQQNDLTLGWVNRKTVVFKRASSSPDKACSEREPNGVRLGGVKKRRRLDLYKKWKSGNFALKNKIIKVDKESKDTKCPIGHLVSEDSLFVKEAEKYLGTKYLLGGKTENGIDCSGLVQVAYKDSLDIILPKHSWDQKEMGKKVNLKNVIFGDLIFLIKKENSHKHVGIVEVVLENNAKRPHINTPPAPLKRGIGTMEPAVVNLIHASLEKKKVIRQRLEEVFENYDFVEARRIVE